MHARSAGRRQGRADVAFALSGRLAGSEVILVSGPVEAGSSADAAGAYRGSGGMTLSCHSVTAAPVMHFEQRCGNALGRLPVPEFGDAAVNA